MKCMRIQETSDTIKLGRVMKSDKRTYMPLDKHDLLLKRLDPNDSNIQTDMTVCNMVGS